MADDEKKMDRLCVVLLDKSGSMGGDRMTQAKQYINNRPERECIIYPFTGDLEAKLDRSGKYMFCNIH